MFVYEFSELFFQAVGLHLHSFPFVEVFFVDVDELVLKPRSLRVARIFEHGFIFGGKTGIVVEALIFEAHRLTGIHELPIISPGLL